jgi:homoserine kinase type II
MERANEWTREAAGAFWGDAPFTVEEGPSGMNNTTRRINIGGELYMLRIYNSHMEPEKARFEHLVLRRLAGADRPLSFRVPEPIAARNGETVVRIGREEGKLAASFRYIEGRRPVLSNPGEAEVFGAAAGELQAALSKVEKELGSDMRPAYPPYYELGSAHPRCSLPEIARFCASPPECFEGERENLRFLSEEVERTGAQLDALRDLPHQLIHGDLNETNALIREDGRMAALLDFEFATWDLRAMEPAVCLWGMVPRAGAQAEAETWEALRAFWRGFRSQAVLKERELGALPVLMQLRSLDVFIHFLGRYLDGVDDSSVLAGQIPETSYRMRWAAANRERLMKLVTETY